MDGDEYRDDGVARYQNPITGKGKVNMTTPTNVLPAPPGQKPISMMSSDGNLGNIDLEDSQTGLPGDAFLPSSAEGSFRSSMNGSS